MEPKSKPHILAIPFPAQGHMNPMFHLCNRLASTGFFITFLVALKNKDFIAPIAKTNFRFVYLPEEFVPQIFTAGKSVIAYLQALETNLNIFLPNIVQDIMRDGPAPQLVCVLTDELITGIDDITTKLGLCRASLSTFSASCLCLRRSVAMLQAKGMLPLQEGDEVIDYLPGLPPIRTKDFPASFKVVDPLDTNFKVVERRCDLSKKNDWVLMNTFYELEEISMKQITSESPQFVPVGPLLPLLMFAQTCEREDDSGASDNLPGLWSEDSECVSWLDKQPVNSVVYVSFGSLAVVSKDQIGEIIEGLENARTPFLCVMRSDMIARSTKLEQVLKESKLGKVVSWAPQLKVLKHASVAAFLTHCGWNSILEAVASSVPVLCWPSPFYEQPLNCALAVDHWKIGFRVSPTPGAFVPAKDVADSVRDIMGDTGRECRYNIQRLSEAMRNGVTMGRSQQNFQAFIEDVRGYPKPKP